MKTNNNVQPKRSGVPAPAKPTKTFPATETNRIIPVRAAAPKIHRSIVGSTENQPPTNTHRTVAPALGRSKSPVAIRSIENLPDENSRGNVLPTKPSEILKTAEYSDDSTKDDLTAAAKSTCDDPASPRPAACSSPGSRICSSEEQPLRLRLEDVTFDSCSYFSGHSSSAEDGMTDVGEIGRGDGPLEPRPWLRAIDPVTSVGRLTATLEPTERPAISAGLVEEHAGRLRADEDSGDEDDSSCSSDLSLAGDGPEKVGETGNTDGRPECVLQEDTVFRGPADPVAMVERLVANSRPTEPGPEERAVTVLKPTATVSKPVKQQVVLPTLVISPVQLVPKPTGRPVAVPSPVKYPVISAKPVGRPVQTVPKPTGRPVAVSNLVRRPVIVTKPVACPVQTVSKPTGRPVAQSKPVGWWAAGAKLAGRSAVVSKPAERPLVGATKPFERPSAGLKDSNVSARKKSEKNLLLVVEKKELSRWH